MGKSSAQRAKEWRQKQNQEKLRQEAAERMRIKRQNETDDEWNNRLDKDQIRHRKLRQNQKKDINSHLERLAKDAKRQQIKRSKESEEDTKVRQLVDATRHFEARAQETDDQHQSRLIEQRARQKEVHEKQTEKEAQSRNDADSRRKILKRAAKEAAYEDTYKPGQDWVTWLDSCTYRTPKWHAALDAERDRKSKSRAAESDDKKMLRKVNDAKYHSEMRDAETVEERTIRREKNIDYERSHLHENWRKRCLSNQKPEPKRPYTEKEADYYGKSYYDRKMLVIKAGSLYKYLVKNVKENLEEDDDIKWIDNKISGEVLMVSDFERLSKKFAVIFSQLGVAKNDVVHFVACDENLIYVALGGLWILGATGSIGNKYKVGSDGKVQLEVDPLQTLNRLKTGKDQSHNILSVKAVICTKETVNETKKAVDSLEPDMKKDLLLLSFGQADGCKNILCGLNYVDESKAPKPINCNNAEYDPCLIFWNFDANIYNCKNESLCHEEYHHVKSFYATKKEWTRRRDEDTFLIFREDLDLPWTKRVYWKGCYFPNKRNIFATFSALEGHRTIVCKQFPRTRSPDEDDHDLDDPNGNIDESMDESTFKEYVNHAVDAILPDEEEKGQKASNDIQNPSVSNSKDSCYLCQYYFNEYGESSHSFQMHITRFHEPGYKYLPSNSSQDNDTEKNDNFRILPNGGFSWVPKENPDNKFRCVCRQKFNNQSELDDHKRKSSNC